MQATHSGRPRIANSLILRIGLLILASLAIFAAGAYRLILLPTVGSLAEAQMGLVSEQLEARVVRLLQSVEATLRSSRGWGMHGDLDQDRLLRFNEFFFPVIENNAEINSVIFADEHGRASREVVDLALTGLACVRHRGAVSASTAGRSCCSGRPRGNG